MCIQNIVCDIKIKMKKEIRENFLRIALSILLRTTFDSNIRAAEGYNTEG